MAFDVSLIRQGFPALARTQSGREVAYLDGPGGTQVHTSVIAAMRGYMERGGSNHGGSFATSVETDAIVADARSAVADLIGANARDIVFGQNMTSLTFSLSRALARTWSPGDTVVVTRLDHDANVTPWVIAAQEAGAEVAFVDFDPDGDWQLDLDTLDAALTERTRLVAVTMASNALGTLTPVNEIVSRAHAVGALTFLDAVHYAPHGSIDVVGSDTDFLATSAYKWFGPHIGCLYGKEELLRNLPPYKLRPSPDTVPDRWETGTQSFESLAGVTAAVDYLASLHEIDSDHNATRRANLISAYDAIASHESVLMERFLKGIETMGHVTLYGLPIRQGRTATFAIEIAGATPQEAERVLGENGIFVWAGDYYAYEVMQRLDKPNGLVRIGFAHYNTLDEVDRVLSVVASLG